MAKFPARIGPQIMATRHLKGRFAALLLGAAFLLPALAAAPTASGQTASDPTAPGNQRTQITVYGDDLAQVTTRRTLAVPAGQSRIAFAPISPGAIADSLDLSAPDLRVREQALSPWPLDRAALLARAVGQEVRIRRVPEGGGAPVLESATLRAVSPTLILEQANGVLIDPEGDIVLSEWPEGLSRTPRALFRVAADTGGAREVVLRYLSRGLSWHAAYVARWDRTAGTLDLTGRGVIESRLDRPLTADRVTLAAGTVAMPEDNGGPEAQPRALMRAAADSVGAAPERAADLRLYHLDDALTLAPGQAVQRPLIEARDIAVAARYRLTGLATARPYDRARPRSANATLRLHIPDTRAAGLDRALPAGRLRVYDGAVFRGAQAIPDTPPGAPLTLDLGAAFDVTAEARQSDVDRLGERRYEVARTIDLRNAGPDPVTVRVVGDFPPDWEMLRESHPHTRESATQPVWAVEVPGESTRELSYRVRVTR